MAVKLAVILAMLAGLVTYAQSSADIGPRAPSRAAFDKQSKITGYIKIEESTNSRGFVVETYEMRTPTKPHYHQTEWLYLICRGDDIIAFGHDENFKDMPDQ